MNVTVNGFSLNSAANYVYLDEPVDGFSIPPIRTSSGSLSGRDGGYIGSQFYGMRAISLQGRIFAADVSTLEDRRTALETAIQTKIVTVNMTTNAGREYQLLANLISFDMPIQRAMSWAPFKIELLAPDPVIYDNAAGGGFTATLARQSGGGLTWPLTWPLVWAAGSLPTIINNTGSVTIYPRITLTGVTTNPILTNVTTGKVFKLTGLTTSPGDVVVIDMKARTVLLNGGPILPFVSSDSSWWGMTSGNNSIQLTTSSGSDTVTGLISWRAGYMGI